MTYEERKRAIFEFLFSDRDGLLRRYTAPEHLSADRQRDEINEIVEEVNSEIPSTANVADLQNILGEMRKSVRRRHGLKTWPASRVLIAAVKDGVSEVTARAKVGAVDDGLFIDLARDWFQKFKKPGPAKDTPEITRALIDGGLMANEREAQWRGFALSDDMKAKAKQQPMGREEREHHFAILGRLRGVSAAEAEAMDKQQTEGFA